MSLSDTITDPHNLLQEWSDRLQADGCRITQARRAVLKVLSEANVVLNPMQVFLAARKQAPRLGLVSVYRTLEIMESHGLIQRVHQANGCNGFLTAGVGHQHLLICTRCGCAIHFEGDDITALTEELSARHGFLIQEHWLQFEGLCPKCQGQAKSSGL